MGWDGTKSILQGPQAMVSKTSWKRANGPNGHLCFSRLIYPGDPWSHFFKFERTSVSRAQKDAGPAGRASNAKLVHPKLAQ